MEIFNLPKSTEFGRVIPKNAFDNFTNSKQKKLISTAIHRITWTHKLSIETTNIKGISVSEIELFHIELRAHDSLKTILAIFDKAIPYHIVFVLTYDDEALISTSAKHIHITKANESVIDCTYASGWISQSEFNFSLKLNESLDKTYIGLCNQISNRFRKYNTYTEFINVEVEIINIEHKISKLTSQIKKEKQFNKRVDMNMKLAKLKQRYTEFF